MTENKTIRVGHLWCTRDAVVVVENFDLDPYSKPGSIGALLEFLQPQDWTPTHLRMEFEWGDAPYFYLHGLREPIESELQKINEAWAKEDAKRQRQRERAQERAKQDKAARENKERAEYERLQKKFGNV